MHIILSASVSNKLLMRRNIVELRSASEQRTRDKLAEYIWEQRRLLQQCQRDNEEIECLVLENDALQAQLKAADDLIEHYLDDKPSAIIELHERVPVEVEVTAVRRGSIAEVYDADGDWLNEVVLVGWMGATE